MAIGSPFTHCDTCDEDLCGGLVIAPTPDGEPGMRLCQREDCPATLAFNHPDAVAARVAYWSKIRVE